MTRERVPAPLQAPELSRPAQDLPQAASALEVVFVKVLPGTDVSRLPPELGGPPRP